MKKEIDFEKVLKEIEEEATEVINKVPQKLFRKEEWTKEAIKEFFIRERVYERELKFLHAQLREKKNIKVPSVEQEEIECQSSSTIELPTPREEERYLYRIGSPLTPFRTPLDAPDSVQVILFKMDKNSEEMENDLTECVNRIDALKAKIKEQEELRQELLTMQDESK